MKTPTRQEISDRAYSLWEERGRPMDQQASEDCWLAAERELSGAAEGSSRRSNSQRGDDDDDVLNLDSGPDVTNMDRALPADERSRARRERGGSKVAAPTSRRGKISEHFIIAADRSRLRIYEERNGGDGAAPLRVASSFDLPEGKQHYTDRDTDQAGRFPGTRGKGAGLGGSTDERLPMLEEQQRRAATELGTRVNTFLHEHPDATWDFAAGPVVHRALLDVLDPDVRERLGEALVKELVNQPLPELRQHFHTATRED